MEFLHFKAIVINCFGSYALKKAVGMAFFTGDIFRAASQVVPVNHYLDLVSQKQLLMSSFIALF